MLFIANSNILLKVEIFDEESEKVTGDR